MAEQDKQLEGGNDASAAQSPEGPAPQAWLEANGTPRILEELHRIQADLASSREQYLDFYDLAPVGYLTLDEAGVIGEVNYTGTTLLGVSREHLVGQSASRFVLPEDRDLFDESIQKIFSSHEPQLVELRMVRSETLSFWVRLGGIAARDRNGINFCRLVLSDITEHRLAEEAVARYETRYRVLYESTSDAVMLLDEKGFFDCNEATVLMFGCRDKAEFCSKHPADLSPLRQPSGADSILLANRHMATALSYGANRFEWTHKRCDDDREFPAEVFLSRLKVDGRSAIMAIVKNISTRKQTEAALARIETRYRVLYESTSDAVMLLDESGFFDANHATLTMFGCRDVAEFRRMHPADVSPANQPCGTDSYTLASRHIAEAIEKGSIVFEWVHKRVDTGAEFSCEVRLSRMHMDGRTVLQALVQDISERKQAEIKLRESYDLLEQRVAERTAQLQAELEEHRRTQQALREREQQLNNLADNLPNAMVYQVIGDISGMRRFTYVGKGVERLNEIAAQEIIENPNKLYHQVLPEYRAEVAKQEQEALEKRTSVRVEVESRLPSGRVRWFEYSSTPRQRADGSVVWDGVEVDITARKEAEKALIETNRHLEEATARANAMAAIAEEANHAKSRFLANISHEIRTPLNAIIGYAQILKQDSSLPEKPREQVNTIYRNGEHLLALINEVLDLSRIEAGRIDLNVEEFYLHDMLEDFDRMFRFSAEGKGLRFVMERAEDIPCRIRADASKLRQVLINILGNAVKFTDAGSIIMRVGVESIPGTAAETPDTARLTVDVEDSGPGIAEPDLEHIFCAFRQSGVGLQSGGTGLGLAISSRLVEIMGGELTVESRLGEGSRFKCSIPVELVADSEETPPIKEEASAIPDAEPVKAVRVLIVDDNPDMRGLLHDLLVPAGYELEEAGNGRDAIELFERWAPDAVLMDMRMPVMDGYEAIRRIKATEKGKNTIVIAETASAFAEDKESILKAGADGYVSKPFRMREILETLKNLLLERSASKPDAPGGEDGGS